jgi:hypothetical protein
LFRDAGVVLLDGNGILHRRRWRHSGVTDWPMEVADDLPESPAAARSEWPAVGATTGLWGSRSLHGPVTCGDQPHNATGHDRRRVAAPALFDPRPAPQLAVAAGPHLVVQEHRAARPTTRGRRTPQNQPQASPGLGRPSRARRPNPTPRSTPTSRTGCLPPAATGSSWRSGTSRTPASSPAPAAPAPGPGRPGSESRGTTGRTG